MTTNTRPSPEPKPPPAPPTPTRLHDSSGQHRMPMPCGADPLRQGGSTLRTVTTATDAEAPVGGASADEGAPQGRASARLRRPWLILVVVSALIVAASGWALFRPGSDSGV